MSSSCCGEFFDSVSKFVDTSGNICYNSFALHYGAQGVATHGTGGLSLLVKGVMCMETIFSLILILLIIIAITEAIKCIKK